MTLIIWYIFSQGLIFIADGVKLDHETTPVYNLQVVATDNYKADISAEVKQISTVAVSRFERIKHS